MFSGIIRTVGTVQHVEHHDAGVRLQVEIGALTKHAALGDSIAHNGVCLTVAAIDGAVVTYDLLDETCQKTTFGDVQVGKKLNLEPSLKLGDPIDGHLVYGHVDGVGKIGNIDVTDTATRITISPPAEIMQYIVPQGAIAVDGVSLTVASYDETSFTISLVPYTIDHTAFHASQVGDTVNVEVDMMAKYACKQI